MEMSSNPWSPVLRYATPLPMNRTPRFNRSAPTKVCFLRFAVRHTPPDQQDPRFDRRRSVSSILLYARPRFHRLFRPRRLALDEHHAFRCLPMNTTHSVASP